MNTFAQRPSFRRRPHLARREHTPGGADSRSIAETSCTPPFGHGGLNGVLEIPRRHCDSGYVLLTVLLLLALAAIALAAVCRATIRQSTDADTAAAELQRRWGMLSTRSTLLPAADGLLDKFAPAGVPRMHASFELTGTRFDVELCDEQAKPNVNQLYATVGRPATERIVRQLVGPGTTVRLRPAVAEPSSQNPANSHAYLIGSADVPDREPVGFGSYNELFPAAGWIDPADPASPANAVTCWGTGRLNVVRASRASIAAVCSPTLTPAEIDRFVILCRSRGSRAMMTDLLNDVHANAADNYALADRLTNVSTTYSAWIVATDKTGTDREMSVVEIDPGTDTANGGDQTRWFLYRW
jgi:hypothetical protein